MCSSSQYHKELRNHFLDQVQPTKLQTSIAQTFRKQIISNQIDKIVGQGQSQQNKPQKKELRANRSRVPQDHFQHQQQIGVRHQEQSQPAAQQSRQQPHYTYSHTQPQQPLRTQPGPLYPQHHHQCCCYKAPPKETYRIDKCKPPCQQGGSTNGGDADRLLYENPNFNKVSPSPLNESVSCGIHLTKSLKRLSLINNNSQKQQQSQDKVNSYTPPPIKLDVASQTAAKTGVSNEIVPCTDISDNSTRSYRSSRTVISRKSANDLRRIVHSQIKMENMIEETLSALNQSDDDSSKSKSDNSTHTAIQAEDDVTESASACPTQQNDVVQMHCRYCCIGAESKKELTNMQRMEAGVGASCANDQFMMTLDEMVNTKVINPMIRKVQRMYVKNLKDEMSLMDDLERLPHMVREVYCANVNK